jgi:hypothetical protein
MRRDQMYFMRLDQLENAVNSLAEMDGLIGIMGGEPTLHPEFKEMCALLQRLNGPERYGIWTSGGPRYDEHRELIYKTFGYIHYNDHAKEELCFHQPSTLAIQDVVQDAEYREKLLEECWVPKEWGPSIGPRGAFFCEVACALDNLLDLDGGFPVEPGWWRKDREEIRAHLRKYCRYCGMAIPMKRSIMSTAGKELFSPGNLELFRKHDLRNVSDAEVEVFERQFSVRQLQKAKKIWRPQVFRDSSNCQFHLDRIKEACRTRSYTEMLSCSARAFRAAGALRIIYHLPSLASKAFDEMKGSRGG